MPIAGLLVYSLFFILIFVGKFLIDYLRDNEQCPCMAKVPFSLLVLGVIIYNYFYTDFSYDGIIWIPVVATATIGNFLIGNISNRFEKLENVGIGFFISGYVYAISAIWYFYGLPKYFTFVLLLSVFGLYLFSSFNMLSLKLKDSWYEYLYIFIMYMMLIFTMQIDVGKSAPIAISLWVYSELINQISRLKNAKPESGFDSATIYLIGMAFIAAPKFL